MGGVGGVGDVVEILVWMARMVWGKKQHGFKFLAVYSYSMENTAPSIEYYLIVPIEFNKHQSSSLSYLI